MIVLTKIYCSSRPELVERLALEKTCERALLEIAIFGVLLLLCMPPPQLAGQKST